MEYLNRYHTYIPYAQYLALCIYSAATKDPTYALQASAVPLNLCAGWGITKLRNESSFENIQEIAYSGSMTSFAVSSAYLLWEKYSKKSPYYVITAAMVLYLYTIILVALTSNDFLSVGLGVLIGTFAAIVVYCLAKQISSLWSSKESYTSLFESHGSFAYVGATTLTPLILGISAIIYYFESGRRRDLQTRSQFNAQFETAVRKYTNQIDQISSEISQLERSIEIQKDKTVLKTNEILEINDNIQNMINGINNNMQEDEKMTIINNIKLIYQRLLECLRDIDSILFKTNNNILSTSQNIYNNIQSLDGNITMLTNQYTGMNSVVKTLLDDLRRNYHDLIDNNAKIVYVNVLYEDVNLIIDKVVDLIDKVKLVKKSQEALNNIMRDQLNGPIDSITSLNTDVQNIQNNIFKKSKNIYKLKKDKEVWTKWNEYNKDRTNYVKQLRNVTHKNNPRLAYNYDNIHKNNLKSRLKNNAANLTATSNQLSENSTHTVVDNIDDLNTSTMDYSFLNNS